MWEWHFVVQVLTVETPNRIKDNRTEAEGFQSFTWPIAIGIIWRCALVSWTEHTGDDKQFRIFVEVFFDSIC